MSGKSELYLPTMIPKGIKQNRKFCFAKYLIVENNSIKEHPSPIIPLSIKVQNKKLSAPNKPIFLFTKYAHLPAPFPIKGLLENCETI